MLNPGRRVGNRTTLQTENQGSPNKGERRRTRSLARLERTPRWNSRATEESNVSNTDAKRDMSIASEDSQTKELQGQQHEEKTSLRGILNSARDLVAGEDGCQRMFRGRKIFTRKDLTKGIPEQKTTRIDSSNYTRGTRERES